MVAGMVLVMGGCGSGFVAGVSQGDASSVDGGLDAESSADQASGADVVDEQLVDAGQLADVDASSPGEASVADAHGDVGTPSDAGTCTPLAFPVPAPKACGWSAGAVSSPGSVWSLEPCSTPPNFCAGGTLAGSAACEQCVETYNCACLGSLSSKTAGQCTDSDSGPYFVTCQ